MPTTFIASIPRSSLEALLFQGISVSESHVQLQSVLHRNLSPEHALFFAEPVMNSDGESVDWYTPLEGDIVPLASLPPEEQQAAFQEVRRIAGDVMAFADSLKQGDGPSRSMRGNILALALTYPGAEYVYMAGKQPLLLGWGFAPASLGAQPEDLLRFGAATVFPPAAPAPAPAGKSNWLRLFLSLLGGLLFILALFFLAGLLFGRSGCSEAEFFRAGCAALPGPVVPGGCSRQPVSAVVPPEVVSALTEEQEKERALRRRINDLRRELSLRIAECPRPKIAEAKPEPPAPEPPKPEPPKPEPPKPEPPAPEPPAPEPPKVEAAEPEPEAPPSLADIMPTTPEVSPPQETPPAPPEPPAPRKEPPPRRVAKGDTLEIPPDAREKNDLSFLEGCWLCETGLYSSATGEPVVVRYCFDARGRGTRNVKEKKTGDNCKGPVTAQFDSSGQLRIRAREARCSRRGAYVPQTVNCTQKGKKAQCYGREDSRNKTRWRATFRRI